MAVFNARGSGCGRHGGIMLARNLIKASWCKHRKRYLHNNNAHIKPENEKNVVTRIRNIGIMAHIDAGV